MTQARLVSSSPQDTEAAAAELASTLERGHVVLVSGELGAGKTTFVRGACRALGVTGPVTSPTYTVGQLYSGAGGLEIAHLDLYRLDSLEPEDPALLDDYLTADRIGFVEWPAAGAARIERVAARVQIAHDGRERRVLSIE